jgi:predicted transcriptional regulator
MRNTTPLQRLADEVGKSQREIARETGLSLSVVSDVFTGKRNPRTDTVNRVLDWAEQYDKSASYDKYFRVRAA